MVIAAPTLYSIFDAVAEVPWRVASWATGLTDQAFLQLMFVGAFFLTVIVARALK